MAGSGFESISGDEYNLFSFGAFPLKECACGHN
jgi:hypothetical protein